MTATPTGLAYECECGRLMLFDKHYAGEDCTGDLVHTVCCVSAVCPNYGVKYLRPTVELERCP